MATTYFENMDFYRDLVSLSLSEEDQQRRPSPSLTAADEDVSDTTICARIRPLSVKEDGSSHISGIVVKDSSKAVLFEPRNKFNGTPDSTVRLIYYSHKQALRLKLTANIETRICS
jgi:hypothetical protein